MLVIVLVNYQNIFYRHAVHMLHATAPRTRVAGLCEPGRVAWYLATHVMPLAFWRLLPASVQRDECFKKDEDVFKTGEASSFEASITEEISPFVRDNLRKTKTTTTTDAASLIT